MIVIVGTATSSGQFALDEHLGRVVTGSGGRSHRWRELSEGS